MYFSISVFELLAIAALAFLAVMLQLRGSAYARWFLAAAISSCAAACVTPADPLSTIVLSIIILAAFAFGLRTGARHYPAEQPER